MAVVRFSRKDLENLVGRKITDNEYHELVPMLGTPVESYDKNYVEFEIFPNRPDLLAIEGMARALQGFLGVRKGPINYDVRKSNYKVIIDKSVKDRKFAAFAVVKGMKFDEELIAEFMQLQEKLSVTIGRKRKKASIGSYDISDVEWPVKYTTKNKSHKFVPLAFESERTIEKILNEHPKAIEYSHLMQGLTSYGVYEDAKGRTMSLLPITNAEFSKIDIGTKDILIEVTGNEMKAVEEMLNVVATALHDRGLELYEVTAEYPGGPKKFPNLKGREMALDINYANKLLDLNMKSSEIKGALEKMRYGVSGDKITIPAYRTDIMHQIDLVEDIAISHGYWRFEPRIPDIPSVAKPDPAVDRMLFLARALAGLRLQEVKNFILSNTEREFGMLRRKKENCVEIENPKTSDYTCLRASLAPGLLWTLSTNASSEMPHRIFEAGAVAKLDKSSETGAVNENRIAAALSHAGAGFSEIKSLFEAFMRSTGTPFALKESKDPLFIEGRAAEVIANGKAIGAFGEVHPEVLDNFGIGVGVTLFEIKVEGLE